MSWSENDKASVNAVGTVNLWKSESELIMPTVMTAGKNLMVGDYQDDGNFCLDLWIKSPLTK